MQITSLEEMANTARQLVGRISAASAQNDANSARAFAEQIQALEVFDGNAATWKIDVQRLELSDNPQIFFTRTDGASGYSAPGDPQLFVPTSAALEQTFNDPQAEADMFATGGVAPAFPPVAQEDPASAFAPIEDDAAFGDPFGGGGFDNYDTPTNDAPDMSGDSGFFADPGLDADFGGDFEDSPRGVSPLDKVTDVFREKKQLVLAGGLCLVALLGFSFFSGGDDTLEVVVGETPAVEETEGDFGTADPTAPVSETVTETTTPLAPTANPYGCGELPDFVEGSPAIAFVVNATEADITNLECLDAWEFNGNPPPNTALRFVTVQSVDPTTGAVVTDEATPSTRQIAFRGTDILTNSDLAYSAYLTALAMGASPQVGVTLLPDSGGDDNGGREVSSAVAAGLIDTRVWSETATRESALAVLDAVVQANATAWYESVTVTPVPDEATPSTAALRAARRLHGAGVLTIDPNSEGFFQQEMTVQEWTTLLARTTVSTRLGLDTFAAAEVAAPSTAGDTEGLTGDPAPTETIAPEVTAPTPDVVDGIVAALASGDASRAAAALISPLEDVAIRSASLSGVQSAGFTISTGTPAPADGLFAVQVELVDSTGAVVATDVMNLEAGEDQIWRAVNFPALLG